MAAEGRAEVGRRAKSEGGPGGALELEGRFKDAPRHASNTMQLMYRYEQ